jgi:hypothetical protein
MPPKRNVGLDLAGAVLVCGAAVYLFGWLGLFFAALGLSLLAALEIHLRNRAAKQRP